MQDEKLQMFRNRLTKDYRHIGRLARRQGITCYRIYDHDLPEFPFCIERYEDKLYLAEYQRRHGMSEEAHAEWLESCIPAISEVLETPDEKIYFRQRRRKAGRQDQYEKLASEEEFFVVREAGLSFRVNLTDYLDTGLFLDHRITRGMVRAEAKGKRVLNLFCYTGSFSVYAAAGGASRVDSVDLSKTYLAWAEANMTLNTGLGGEGNGGRTESAGDDADGNRLGAEGSRGAEGAYRFIHADVKQWLGIAPERFYDLVVMDPPTFSNSKRMKDFLDIQRDHAELIDQALRAMTPGGILYFSTNYRRFELEREKIKAASIKDITNATTPFDFQRKLFRWCYRIVK